MPLDHRAVLLGVGAFAVTALAILLIAAAQGAGPFA